MNLEAMKRYYEAVHPQLSEELGILGGGVTEEYLNRIQNVKDSERKIAHMLKACRGEEGILALEEFLAALYQKESMLCEYAYLSGAKDREALGK